MEQNQNKGAVLKGLAFPIGYSTFMNIFQTLLALLVAGICLARALLVLIAVPEIGIPNYVEQFMLDYTNMLQSNTWFMSVITTVLALVILWIVFNRKGKNFAEYFRFTPASAKALLTAALLGLGLFCITNAVMSLLENALFLLLDWALMTLEQAGTDTTPITDYINQLLETMNMMYDGVGMFIVAAILGAPIVEELVFRAGPLKHLTKKMPVVAAVMLTSALFALAHGNPVQMIYTFALGVACAYLYIKTDSIYPSILCHFAFNGANLFATLMSTLFDTDRWMDSPYYTEIFTQMEIWSSVIYWIYLIGSLLIGIPLLLVGIMMLIKLRRTAPGKTESQEVLEQIFYSDDAQMIAAAPSLASLAEQEAAEEHAQEVTEAAEAEPQAPETPATVAAEEQNSEEDA